MTKRTRATILVLAAATLGACAPVSYGGGPGVHVGFSPGAGLQISQCGLLPHSPEAMRMGVRSPAITMGAMRNQVSQLQARFALGSQATNDPRSWQRIASGEC